MSRADLVPVLAGASVAACLVAAGGPGPAEWVFFTVMLTSLALLVRSSRRAWGSERTARRAARCSSP